MGTTAIPTSLPILDQADPVTDQEQPFQQSHPQRTNLQLLAVQERV